MVATVGGFKFSLDYYCRSACKTRLTAWRLIRRGVISRQRWRKTTLLCLLSPRINPHCTRENQRRNRYWLSRHDKKKKEKKKENEKKKKEKKKKKTNKQKKKPSAFSPNEMQAHKRCWKPITSQNHCNTQEHSLSFLQFPLVKQAFLYFTVIRLDPADICHQTLLTCISISHPYTHTQPWLPHAWLKWIGLLTITRSPTHVQKQHLRVLWRRRYHGW